MPPGNEDIRLSIALAGDEVRAFDTLYEKYHNIVFANIFKLVNQQEAAEDILQDVFAALWINRHKISEQGSVGGWLFVVSHNKALKFLDKAVRERILAQEGAAAAVAESPESNVDPVDYQFLLISEAIERLSPQKKLVFTLCKLEGRSYEEAARIAGISPHTVKEYVGTASRFIKAYSLRRFALDTPLSLSALIALVHHL